MAKWGTIKRDMESSLNLERYSSTRPSIPSSTVWELSLTLPPTSDSGPSPSLTLVSSLSLPHCQNLSLSLSRAVGGAVDDGAPDGPVNGSRAASTWCGCPFPAVCLLGSPDSGYPADYGGPVCLPSCSSTSLVDTYLKPHTLYTCVPPPSPPPPPPSSLSLSLSLKG